MSDLDNEEYEPFGFGQNARDGKAEVAAVPDDDADLDDDDDDDDLEDASDDEIDFVIAAYREDGQTLVQALNKDLANDLEDLIVQLRRLPGDAGAIGWVSLVEEVFVIVRVRGRHVQVLLSDGTAATDWPIARDVADLLEAEIPDPDDDAEPMGDLNLLADLGMSDFDLGAIVDNLDLSSDQMLIEVAEKIKIGPQFRRVAEAAFHS
ncbi:MAG: tRNA adenosine deaminase-associated protein [Propionibacteriaceae bacterium]